jgi:hypothetical protein
MEQQTEQPLSPKSVQEVAMEIVDEEFEPSMDSVAAFTLGAMRKRQGYPLYIVPEAVSLIHKAFLLVSTQVRYVSLLYHCPRSSERVTMASSAYQRPRVMARNINRAIEDDEREIFRLKDSDYELVVDYLEVPKNFVVVVVGGRKTSVGKKYGTKAGVFKKILAPLQHHGFPSQITSLNLQK